MSEKIEKPWAVYGDYRGSEGIGKIVNQEDSVLWIKYSEDMSFRHSEPWDPKWVKTFDSPIKAIAYLLVHQNQLVEHLDTKQGLLNLVSERFPSQKEYLKKYKKQTKIRTPFDATMLQDYPEGSDTGLD